MTKLALIVAFLAALAGNLQSAGLDAEIIGHPTSADISWASVPGASWYDIYSGDTFIARLESSEREYSVEGLFSSSDYSFSIAARDQENNTLDADFLSVVHIEVVILSYLGRNSCLNPDPDVPDLSLIIFICFIIPLIDTIP